MKNKIVSYIRNNRNKTATVLGIISAAVFVIIMIAYNIGPLEGWNKGGNVLVDFFLLSCFAVPFISAAVLYEKGTDIEKE